MPRTDKHYKTIDKSTRDKLEALYNIGMPVKRIAEELGYTFQSIYRELKRGYYMKLNHDYTYTRRYSADIAQTKADINGTAKGRQLKLGKDYKFVSFVEKMVKQRYSPAAILGFIQENGLEFDTKICRVTLYNYIDKGLFLNVSNKDLLRKSKLHKKRKKVREQKQPLKILHSIEKRPSEVSRRASFGHWELDSVIGKNCKGETLHVLTERYTRMELIFKSPDKTAASTVTMLNRLERQFGSINFRKIFKTITCDNGCEFANTSGMEISPYTRKKRTSVYYCHPFCSSERGSNENQNGFIRRFIPKGVAISTFSHAQIRQIQDFINSYPRELFGWQNSLKLFQNELKKLNIKIFT